MIKYFEITSYNTETTYCYGTDTQLSKYLAYLNRDRDVNWFYGSEVFFKTEDECLDSMAFNLDDIDQSDE